MSLSPRPFLALVLLSAAVSQADASEAAPPAVALPITVDEIAPAQVVPFLAKHADTLIVDVRTEEERRARGSIPNAIHHDYFHGQQSMEALGQLDKTRPCIIYCAMGGRAKMMAVEMEKLGFKRLLVLKGGFNAWVAEGQPVAK